MLCDVFVLVILIMIYSLIFGGYKEYEIRFKLCLKRSNKVFNFYLNILIDLF